MFIIPHLYHVPLFGVARRSPRLSAKISLTSQTVRPPARDPLLNICMHPLPPPVRVPFVPFIIHAPLSGQELLPNDLPAPPIDGRKLGPVRGTLRFELPLSPHTGVDAAPPTPHWCRPRSALKERFSCPVSRCMPSIILTLT
jgi:hypothetical protein